MFLHIDMDSFFISAERSRDHTLRGIPSAVGSRSDLSIFERERKGFRLMDRNSGAFVAPLFHRDGLSRDFRDRFVDVTDAGEKTRGIITTASYEARAMGVETGMPIAHAMRLCPDLRVVPSDMLFYHEKSFAISSFLSTRLPKIQQYSIDEFFVDISGWVDDEDVESFSNELQREIFERFHIPVSIGISEAKWIAKLATSFAKPYGIYRVEDIKNFIKDIPIKKFPGIGKGYARRLEKRGIYLLGEIEEYERLFDSWGKYGKTLYLRILGRDGEGIEPGSSRKSIGISRTFDPIGEYGELRRRTMVMARHISHIVMKLGLNPVRYTLYLKYEYGERRREKMRVDRLFSENLLKESMLHMLERIYERGKRCVKLSLSVDEFISIRPRTLSLLTLKNDMKLSSLSGTVALLRERYGLDIVKTANELA